MKNNTLIPTPPSLEEIKLAVDILNRLVKVDDLSKAVVLRFDELVIFITRMTETTEQTPPLPFFN